MMFAALGFLVIAMFLMSPLFNLSRMTSSELNRRLQENQVSICESLRGQQIKALAYGVGGISCGFLAGVGVALVGRILIHTYMSDGFIKGILLFSLDVSVILMFASFAIQSRIIFDAWLGFKNSEDTPEG